MGIFAAYIVPDLFDDHTAYTVAHIEPHVLKPKTVSNPEDNPTFQKAINGPNADSWWKAMEVEHRTLENDSKAWKLAKRKPWMKVLPGTWAFKLKQFPDGLVKKIKARFYVLGSKKVKSIDFFEVWCPVVLWSTVHLMMTLSLTLDSLLLKLTLRLLF